MTRLGSLYLETVKHALMDMLHGCVNEEDRAPLHEGRKFSSRATPWTTSAGRGA